MKTTGFIARRRAGQRPVLMSKSRVGQFLITAVPGSFVLLAVLAVHTRAAQVTLRAQPEKSKFNIELGTAGLLKFIGDEHLIAVTDYQCDVLLDEQTLSNSGVKIAIRAASLKVMDPKLAAEKRAEVQTRMQGPGVLDITRYPQIIFVSRRIKPVGTNRYQVEGDLRVRDTTRPVVVEVFLVQEGNVRHAKGEARIRQTSLGIEPVSAGAGTVKVKDEMKIVFDLALAPANQ